MLKVLHTSDWHIGKSLFSKKRFDEFECFLDWLVSLIQDEAVDVLLVSGDIFDTTTPSNRALELYYSFLSRTAKTDCKKIIITGGNHDSATSLDAPKQLLNALNISVVGAARDDLSEEVIRVQDENGRTELIVCAVPYLRERDIRLVDAGESLSDKVVNLRNGVREHYARVVEEAGRQRTTGVPLIVMGHLFAANALSSESESERELYVGNLAHVDVNELPDEVDYYALGHLHIPQRVGGCDNKRYSGSPLAMGFGEAEQKKLVLMLEFAGGDTTPVISEIPVPVFQKLKKVGGELAEILAQIEVLKNLNESVWIEVEYTGEDICSDLRQRIDDSVLNSKVEVRRVRNITSLEYSLSELALVSDTELEDMDDDDVFKKCLECRDFSPEQVSELNAIYKEIRNDLFEADCKAE